MSIYIKYQVECDVSLHVFLLSDPFMMHCVAYALHRKAIELCTTKKLGRKGMWDLASDTLGQRSWMIRVVYCSAARVSRRDER